MADSVARRGAAPGRLGRTTPAGPTASPSAQRRYLSFLVAGIPMGMDLAAVQEVAEVPPMCRIPRPAGAAEFVAVVRGRAVLVVDLRRRLGLVNPVTDQRTRLIVTAGLARPWALLVDAATEVLTVDAIPPDTEASPGAGLRADLFAGSIPAHGRRLFLPDLGKVLGSP